MMNTLSANQTEMTTTIRTQPMRKHSKRPQGNPIAVICLLIALFLILAISPAAAQSETSNAKDEAAIRAAIHQMEVGWNALDGAIFAAPFDEAADYVIINGMHIQGRQAIDEGHQRIFDTIYKDSELDIETKQIRFVRPDVAIAHAGAVLRVRRDGAEHTMQAIITLVLTEDDGTWQITAFQNTGIEPPAGS